MFPLSRLLHHVGDGLLAHHLLLLPLQGVLLHQRLRALLRVPSVGVLPRSPGFRRQRLPRLHGLHDLHHLVAQDFDRVRREDQGGGVAAVDNVHRLCLSSFIISSLKSKYFE